MQINVYIYVKQQCQAIFAFVIVSKYTIRFPSRILNYSYDTVSFLQSKRRGMKVDSITSRLRAIKNEIIIIIDPFYYEYVHLAYLYKIRISITKNKGITIACNYYIFARKIDITK